jgi:hypothetical protein
VIDIKKSMIFFLNNKEKMMTYKVESYQRAIKYFNSDDFSKYWVNFYVFHLLNENLSDL